MECPHPNLNQVSFDTQKVGHNRVHTSEIPVIRGERARNTLGLLSGPFLGPQWGWEAKGSRWRDGNASPNTCRIRNSISDFQWIRKTSIVSDETLRSPFNLANLRLNRLIVSQFLDFVIFCSIFHSDAVSYFKLCMPT